MSAPPIPGLAPIANSLQQSVQIPQQHQQPAAPVNLDPAAAAREAAKAKAIAAGVVFKAFPDQVAQWPANKKIVGVFNHKGGVGKSTSTVSIGWRLAANGYRVLLVDADPQCNLTGFLVDPGYDLIPEAQQPDDDPLVRFYANYPHANIRSALAPLLGSNELKDSLGIPGGSDLLTEVFQVSQRNLLLPIDPTTGRPFGPFTTPPDSLFLLAGHLLLHEYEDAILAATINPNASAQAPDAPGVFYHLLQSLIARHGFDYVLVDMSPSAWVVNRLIVSSVHHLVVPCSCDFFSHMAVRSLARMLLEWDTWKEGLRTRQRPYPVRYRLPEHKPVFLGHTFQLFGVYDNQIVAAFARWITRINLSIRDELIPALERRGMALTPQSLEAPLALIRNTQSAGAAANKVHCPVWMLNSDLLRRGGTNSIPQSIVIRDDLIVQFNSMAQAMTTRWAALAALEQQHIQRAQYACHYLQSFNLDVSHAAFPTTAAMIQQANTLHIALLGGPLP